MTEDYIAHRSFLFGNVDMYTRFGIYVTKLPQDALLPAFRPRKVTIPQRSGAYDFGAKYNEERSLPISCTVVRDISRETMREVAYVLSKKMRIRIWNEPGKYYIGRIYDPPSLIQERRVKDEFDLIFVCDPYAYGSSITENFDGLNYVPNYLGTRETPTRITITNTGTTNAVGIRIIQIDRKDQY